ncbi:hypothetical protein FRC11_014051 [Ceratobasidium sp. 423]|nr:hypothetical protein FRC11_014051 [Ceratobasidium sp. 423]
MIRPFSALKSIRKQLGADASAHQGLGRFHWADVEKTIGVYRGVNIPMAGIQNMAHAMYLKTKELLDIDVLKSLPYSVLRISEIDLKALRDIMDQSTYRYSVWRDVANASLHTIRDSLISAFMTHPSLDGHFYRYTAPDGSPIWDDAARKAWLEKVGELSLHLLGCVQAYSGLSHHGQEIVKMRNHNVQTRLRNLFKFGEYLIYILGYSKTTAQTGKDRLDVHALPPKISEMLMIFNTIVCPVAVQWLKELNEDQNDPDLHEHLDTDEDVEMESVEAKVDDNEQPDEDGDYQGDSDEEINSEDEDMMLDSKGNRSKTSIPRRTSGSPPNTKRHVIQDELTFSWSGQPFTAADLSQLFGKFSKAHVGVWLGIQAWRHIQEAIRRDLLGYTLEESDKYDNTFFHLQAGHTAKIAALFYAVSDGDRTVEASESIIKYITASKAMQSWLDREPLPPIPGPGAKLATQLTTIENATTQMSSRIANLEIQLGITEGAAQAPEVGQLSSSMQGGTLSSRLEKIEAQLAGMDEKFEQLFDMLKK